MSQSSNSSASRRQAGGRRATRSPLLLATVAVAVLVVAAIVVAVALGWPAARRAATSAPSKSGAKDAHLAPLPLIPANPLLPPSGDLLGAWVQPNGHTVTDVETSIRSFEHVIGRRLAIDSLYASWSQTLPLSVMRWDLRGGRVPMISWGQVNSAAVVSGRYDRKIRAVARELKSLHGPVLLRFFPEMTNEYIRSKAISGPEFVAEWRHVFTIFQSVHASNVQWVWCPTAQGYRLKLASQYYPGDAYVDWIGADGYNWGTIMTGSTWRSFSQTFSDFYQWAEHRPKPLMIAEFGSAEGASGAKATWLTQAASALQTRFPRIRAVVYFNSLHPNFGYTFNWKVTSSPSALAAFKAIAASRFFTARPVLGKRSGS